MPALPARYVSRAGWSARKPKERPIVLRDTAVDTVVTHYSASNADEQADHKNCPARIRSTQDFHMDTRGWNDIAYNFLVCKHGWIFEGRGIDAKSAATGADNGHTLAVCFLGDDTAGRDDVTPAGRRALVEITRWIRQKRPSARRNAGHRDFMPTSCPGNELYDYITSAVFRKQLEVDEKAALRKQILAWRAGGWGWARIKSTPTWRRFRALGGK